MEEVKFTGKVMNLPKGTSIELFVTRKGNHRFKCDLGEGWVSKEWWFEYQGNPKAEFQISEILSTDQETGELTGKVEWLLTRSSGMEKVGVLTV